MKKACSVWDPFPARQPSKGGQTKDISLLSDLNISAFTAAARAQVEGSSHTPTCAAPAGCRNSQSCKPPRAAGARAARPASGVPVQIRWVVFSHEAQPPDRDLTVRQ